MASPAQPLHNSCVSTFGREYLRFLLINIDCVQISSSFKQPVDNGQVTLLSCSIQCCASEFALMSDVRAMVEKGDQLPLGIY
jgi:hypothetical protein